MIDWERVQELQDEIGPEHMQEVIELFITEVEEQLAGLNHTLDIVDLGKAIHFLKGCSLNIGFRVVAKLCRQLEEETAQANHRQLCLCNLIPRLSILRIKHQN